MPTAAALTVVFVGNSITGSIPPGGSTTPGQQACTLLSTRLGMTVNFQLAPWHGLTPGVSGAGAQTTDDLPSDPRGTGNYAAATALAAGTPPLYHVMIGTNDARYTSNSAATFGANLGAICSSITGLVSTGAKVILSYDPAFDTSVGGYNTAGNLALLASYQAKYDALVDNATIFAGDKTAYGTFLANLSWLYDGTHPDNTNGVPTLASAWATALAPIICRYVAWSPPAPVAWPFA